MALDPSRAVLPGGAVSLSTVWAQRAVRAAGTMIAVDGRAGPATLTALESFRAARVPQDTVRPSGEATSPSDRAPARVIIGLKTEQLLNTILNTSPNSSAAQSDMTAQPSRTPGIVIGPNLDPTTAPATVGSSGSWVPWAIGGAVLAAIAGGVWWSMRSSSSARGFKPSRKIRVKRRR